MYGPTLSFVTHVAYHIYIYLYKHTHTGFKECPCPRLVPCVAWAPYPAGDEVLHGVWERGEERGYGPYYDVGLINLH